MNPSPPLQLIGTWQLAEPAWLVLLIPALFALPAVWIMRASNTRRLARYAHADRLEHLAGKPRWLLPLARGLTLSAALTSLSVAMARPQSNPVEVDSERTGRDVVFLLDVSRSMLASDVAPTRLDRARLWIKDLVAELRGDRFALVAFAGSASVRAPLTSDNLFFSQVLGELTPESVDRGGTNIGDAIRKTMELVVPQRDDRDAGAFTDIVLITDGEDQQSLPVQAAQAAAQRGVRIIAIGIGSKTGATIRSSEGSRETVSTRLDSQTLTQIAAASPANAYLEVGTGTLDLPRFYRDLIATAEQTALEQVTTIQYTERFHWFLWPAFALLAAERILIPARTRSTPW
ncbi:MAG: VWA domain-containing protein [Planctomycetota bacterium]